MVTSTLSPKVLFLSNYYPPCEKGGYEQLCHDVVERLRLRGYEVAVLTSNFRPNGNGYSDPAFVHRLLRLQPVYGSRLSPALQFFLTRRRDEAYDVCCLRRLLAEIRPDAVFIWNLQFLPRSLAVEAEARPETGVAYWLAGYTPAEPDEFWCYWELLPAGGFKKAFKYILSRQALQIMRREGKPIRPRMEHVGVVSQYYRTKSIAEGWMPPQARVIYNGVELERFFRPVCPRTAGPLRLLQAGRVAADKGVHTALEAVSCLVHELDTADIHLTIAGSGDAAYLSELQQFVGRHGIERQITFTGWLPREEMPVLMHRSDVLLLPTPHQEPFARVVLEGMAAGLAVVATLTGGTGEIVRQEETGLTFPAGDGLALARQIQRLAVNEPLRCSLARSGQEMVREKYGLERMIDGLEDLLAEAIEEVSMSSHAHHHSTRMGTASETHLFT
jgi:glycosyltransferase involved in cell wall biosynthesis